MNKEQKGSGFDCPVYGVLIPKEYTTVETEDGVSYLVPPEGTKEEDIPKDLRPYCRIKEKLSEDKT